MSKTLILADIHHKIARADAIVDYVMPDKTIYLGDYLDSYDDTPEMARKTAIWLKKKLEDPSNIMLGGNHDFGYRYPNRATRAGGFEVAKSLAINDIMDYKDWSKLKDYYVEHGIMFSHAGVSTRFLNHHKAPKNLKDLIEWLDSQLPVHHSLLYNSTNSSIFGSGFSRNGRYPVGGITWCDFGLDMMPTEFPQIVGHSYHASPRFIFRKHDSASLDNRAIEDSFTSQFKSEWWALDLDTHLNHFATIEDNILTVKEISWKRGEGINKLDEVSYSFERFSGNLLDIEKFV